MNRVCVINVVGLTPNLLQHAPRLRALAPSKPWESPLPAVTSTCQATMLTGKMPDQHGIVGNGWFYRDTQEIRFWQQARTLIQADVFYERYETANLFWWFNQATRTAYGATPKPYYGCDGNKAFDILDWTGLELTKQLGPFPFFSFWGPAAGIDSSDWIADATALVLKDKKPQLTFCYLPHLDYDYQRYPDHAPERVAEVDAAAGRVIDAASHVGATVIAVSEYGLTPVDHAVEINRVLRHQGWLTVRDGPFGETLMPDQSDAFAVVDHQLAHVYVRSAELRNRVREVLEDVAGVQSVVSPETLGLDHERSGEWIALSEPNAWFTYDYWLDDDRAPDFARTVDIHRKPGYDPRELFMTSRARAALRVMQKKLGFRYKMDVIPLDTSLVRGSHGLHPEDPADGPLIIGNGELPNHMCGLPAYVCSQLDET